MDDATGRMERVMESALSRLEKIQDKVLPSVANRSLGSEKMTRPEMLQDYGTVKNDTVLLDERLKEYQAQHGPTKGIGVWMDWIEDAEKG